MISNKKQQQQLLIVMLLAGGYYFMIYLPQEEERKKKHAEQERLNKEKMKAEESEKNKLKEAKKQAINDLKAACDKYELNKAIAENFIGEIKKAVAINQVSILKEKALNAIKEELIKKKKFHWRRKIEKRSWADEWLILNTNTFEKAVKDAGGEEAIYTFNISAPYTIYFPPSLYENLSEEQKIIAEKLGHKELELSEKTMSFRFNKMIDKWYDKVVEDPVRGEADPNSSKDNNALFYGTGGTGKTSIAEKLAYEADKYPLIEIKGSTLTPRKQDIDIGITPLEKFIFTLCDIDHTLVDEFGFEREENGEVRYILFVDEADRICKHTAIDTYTKLTFLKECMEGVDKESQSQNLWIFATNYLDLIDPPVYRPGRLSNPLDFSWTLGDFMFYADQASISSDFPPHWLETTTLNTEDNKWVNKFNYDSFRELFLPFWDTFITNAETQKKLKQEKERDEDNEEVIVKKGIQWGEFFEFFWNLKESGQLEHFDGKFISPRKDKIEDILDIRLGEMVLTLDEEIKSLKNEMELARQDKDSFLELRLQELQKKINTLEDIIRNE